MSKEKTDLNPTGTSRRELVKRLLLGTGAVAAASAVKAEEEMRFPGDPTDHNVVYQFNKADADYHKAVMFSVGEMVRKYGDNIKIVVVCFGPGLHILAKKPKRPVAKEIQERVSSLHSYGVEFHACGNTMDSLKWTKNDMVDFAKVVQVGAADLIELQEKGFSYISW
ncbi:MAG: DsrE family protein [Gammaproteobacteria bacterium]|nr:DsrE family protein [Gammaproteobacteria bacterium]